MKLPAKSLAALALIGMLTAASAQQGETVKIVRIDPQSGLLGSIGINQLKTHQYFAEKFSGTGNPAGVKFVVAGIDNKLSPAESLNVLKSAIDQGVRYIAQGNGSAVTFALIDAINKHNERNPGKEVLLLDDAAVDPELTNSKCSYWHFRFASDTAMMLEAMTAHMQTQKGIKSVYIFGQNYAHGIQVAALSKEMLARKRPDIKIAGEDLHPLGQVRDFAPYIAKIKASGADTVITGNWGSDLSLLIKAANEAGFSGQFYTFFAAGAGTPTALGPAGADKVYMSFYSHPNLGGQMAKIFSEFKAKYNEDLVAPSIMRMYEVLGAAIAKAKSTDPVKVAAAMEGIKVKSNFGEVEMRKADHQLQQPMYVSVWQKADKTFSYSPENTGMTFAPVQEFANYVSSTPTSCQMKRPS